MIENTNQERAKEYAAMQAAAGLSNSQAAAFFAVNLSTIKRWRNGERRIPQAAIYALHYLIKEETKL